MRRKRICLLPALLAPIFALTLLLSACAAAPAVPETQPEPADQTAQEPVVGPADEPAAEDRLAKLGIAWQTAQGIHPYVSTSIPNQAAMSLVYEGLFAVDADFSAHPVLCESCTASSDNTVWTFTLREGVRFSDGTPLTAQDVVDSLSAARNSSNFQTRFRNVASMTADSDRTLTVTLTTSYENLPLILDVPILKSASIGYEVPIGTGPYYPTAGWLMPNDLWWGDKATVEKDRIRLVDVENTERARDEFQFGDVDLVYSDPTSSDSADYHCDYELWSCPTTVMLYVGFNTNGRYFASKNLRCSLTYLIDREKLIVEQYGGFGLPTTLPCSPLCPWYDAALANEYATDELKFEDMFRSSGVSPDPANPVKLLVTDNSNRRIAVANAIAEAMTDRGIKTVVETYDTLNFRYKLAIGEYDMYVSEIKLPPNFDLGCFFAAYGTASFGGIGSDTLLARNAKALENSGNYYDLYRMILRDGYLCPLMFKVNALYASRGLLGTHTPAVQWALEAFSEQTVSDILNTPSDSPLP